jgi:hypothetical protein
METVQLERVRVGGSATCISLSSELAQRELTFDRAKRADVVAARTNDRQRSNWLRRTTSPGGVRLTGTTAVKIRNRTVFVFDVL